MNYSSIRSSGLDARGWSRTGAGSASATSATAYNLVARASSVNPSDGPVNRYFGLPVRCLVILCYNFVRSGDIHLATSSLRTLGRDNLAWSRTAVNYLSNSSASSYIMDFDGSGVYPTTGPNNRYYGYPVRCLVYYFVRSGGQDLSVGTLRNAGINNVQWSNISSHYTNLNQSRSYSCAIVELQTMPSNTNERQVGFPVRCLVYWLHFRP